MKMTKAAEWLFKITKAKFMDDPSFAINVIHYASQRFTKYNMQEDEEELQRREEVKFKHQSAVVDAIETCTHDTDTCQSARALAGLTFGRWDKLRQLLFYDKVATTNEVADASSQISDFKWQPKDLSKVELPNKTKSTVSEGILMPKLISGRQLRRHRRKMADSMGMKALTPDGSSVHVQDMQTIICEGLIRKSRARAIAEVNEVQIKGDAHGKASQAGLRRPVGDQPRVEASLCGEPSKRDPTCR